MVRYAPMAEVKVLSLASLIEKLTNQNGGTRTDSFAQGVQELATTVSQNYDALYHYLRNVINTGGTGAGDLFTTIGVATNISLSEDYGTRPVYGIGEPTNPALVPNNLALRVSISKLTIDKAAVSRYVAKPIYWYQHRLQRFALDSMLSVNGDLLGADFFFYTYLVLKDLEIGGLSTDYVEALDNDYIVAFMPRDFSHRITNTTTIIEQNVNGEAKALRIIDIVNILADKLAAG